MREIKKLFFSLILFLFYANIAKATTKGTYVIEEDDAGKKLLVFIGIVLIVLIIFLVYKSDKKEERNIRRENKKSKTDEITMLNYAQTRALKKEDISYEGEEDNDFYVKTNISKQNNEKVISKSEKEATMVIDTVKEKNKIKLLEEMEKTAEIKKIVENEEKEEIEETEEAEKTEEDEDLELLELEETIKAANIRRYTRKKKKSKSNEVKRFTRVVKRPVEEPPKRGRPRKIETSQIKETVTRKRGRPPKPKTEEVINTPKRGRGRPRKN